MTTNTKRKWLISGIAIAISTLFFYFVVHLKTPDLSSSYLLCVLPILIGEAALVYISGMGRSAISCGVIFAFHFLLSAGNAFQIILGVNEPTKILLLNTVALVGASVALTVYVKVIKKKVLITKEGYRISIYVTAGVILFLFLTLFIFGEEINDARLWLRFGSQTIELSEIIKLLFYILLALIYNSNLNTKTKIIYGSVALFASSGFLVLLGEVGTVILLFAVYIVSFYIHIRSRYSMLMICAFFVLLAIALGVVFGTHDLIKDNHTNFITYELNQAYDRLTQSDTDQMTRSIQGMINGGLFGADPIYIIDIYSIEADFALSGIAQYMGMIVMLLCVLSVAAVVYLVYLRGNDDSVNNRSRFKLGYIFSTAIAFQSLLSLAGNIGLPCAGVGMPGLSAGGTQMLTLFIEIAFIVYGLLDQEAADYQLPSEQIKIDRSNYYVED